MKIKHPLESDAVPAALFGLALVATGISFWAESVVPGLLIFGGAMFVVGSAISWLDAKGRLS